MLNNFVNERNITLLLIVLCTALWFTNQVSGIGFLTMILPTGFLLTRLGLIRQMSELKLRRRAMAQPQQSPERGIRSVRAAALNSLPTPVMIINRDYIIVLANDAARLLLDNAAVGKDFSLYLRQPQIVSSVKQALDSGSIDPRLHEDADAPLRYTTADERSFDLTVALLSDDQVAEASAQDSETNCQVMVFFYETTSMHRAERMRVDFVANASHELRTPLSSLIGSIETLQGPAKDDTEAQGRFLSIMQRESDRMIRLIDDLLSLSRIEMSRHRVPSEIVDINNSIQHSISTAQSIATQRNINFNIEIDETAYCVCADDDQIMQVLLNLLVNAAKYADEGTAVHITTIADLENNDLLLTIRDEGPGISAEHLGRLTERFYRVDTARSRKMGGTGLGLAIVKHILLRHKSQLEIKSHLGIGTSFSFRLPLADTEKAETVAS